jgi:hypothetical protein
MRSTLPDRPWVAGEPARVGSVAVPVPGVVAGLLLATVAAVLPGVL